MQYKTMRISVYSFIISAILLTASCSSINKKCKDGAPDKPCGVLCRC